MKGLEGGWEPVVCTNDDCEFRERVNHMHCPLCPRKVCSQDVAYMKMHFRVKHIDEGVDCEEGIVMYVCNLCKKKSVKKILQQSNEDCHTLKE